MNTCMVARLGVLEYSRAWELQKSLVQQRWEGKVDDLLLLLEHPHVYTVGRRGKESDILLPQEAREALGIGVYAVDRGGEVTYHGPGQLVGYPILDLRSRGGPIKYVRALETAIIETLDFYEVGAERVEGLTGVWVQGRKVAAIGVKVSRGVTSHGFALNVNTNLRYFQYIVPCGLRDKEMTSLSRELGHTVPLAEIEERLAHAFGRVMGFQLRWASHDEVERLWVALTTQLLRPAPRAT